MQVFHAKLGDNIRAEIARRRWTQERLAKRAGFSARTVATLIKRHTGKLEHIEAIAKAFGVPLQTILPASATPNEVRGESNAVPSVHDTTKSSGSKRRSRVDASMQKPSQERAA